MISADVIQRERAFEIGAIVRSRGLVLHGRGRDRVGPCPRCGGTDRFAIHLGKQLFNCRRCGAKGGDAIALVQFLDYCSFCEAAEKLAGKYATISADQPFKIEPPQQPPSDNREPTRRALQIWDEAEAIGALPAAYLERRGVALDQLPIDIGSALRWHPACPWEREICPCLVALWTDVFSSEPRAIHRRPINAAAKASANWRALGATSGCVIRLWPDNAVTQGLVLGEGVETVLSAATRIQHHGTLLQPAWAAGDAGHMAAFSVLAGVTVITLLVDHDANGAGQRAAAECARRWVAARREVIRLTPRVEGTDFSDVVGS